jgi:hypothetical protein
VRAGGGVHEHPPQCVHRVPFAFARQGHGVLGDPPPATFGGRFVRVTVSDVVDLGGRVEVQRGQCRGRGVGLRRGGDEPDTGFDHRRDVVVGHQFGVPDQQELPWSGHLLQRGHRPYHLGDLPRSTVVGPVQDRHPAIAGGRQPGLDLLQIRATVLRVPETRRRVVRVELVVGPIQRDRCHVPMASGHIDPERRDRLRTNGSDDPIEFGGDRVQRAADPVVVEQRGVDAEDLLHRVLTCPVGHPDQRRR